MRGISILMATAFLDMVGFAMVFPLLPFYALDLDARPWMVGFLIATFSVVQLVSAPLWGRFSDRYGRRPALLVGLLASALAFLVFGLATSVWMLFLSRFVQGAGGGTTGVAQAYIGDAFEPRDRARSLGWLSAATSAGVMLGPAIGSFLSGLGRAAPGLFAAALCTLNLVFAWIWLPEPERRSEAEASPGQGPGACPKRRVAAMVFDLLRAPRDPVARVIWIYTVGMLGFSTMTAVLALFLRARFAITERTIGYFFVYTGTLSLVMRGYALGRILKRLGEVRVMQLGAALLALGLLAIPLPGSLPGLAVAMALVPMGTACLFPTTSALVSQRASRHELGQTLGVQQSFGGAARVIAPIAATAAFEAFGPSTPFLAAAAVVGVVLLLALREREVSPAAASAA